MRPPSDFRPTAKLIINGEEASPRMAAALSSVSVTSYAGGSADTCEIVIDNSAGFAAPPKGAEVQVYIGYAPTPAYRGRFRVTGWTKDSPLKTLSVRGAAADLAGFLKTTRMRSYHEMTLGAIVRQLAERNGLTAVVQSPLNERHIEHIDQQTESDLAFLTRLAQRNGATFKFGDGKLILADRGSAQRPNGEKKSEVLIKPSDVSTWSVSQEARSNYATASSQYIDGATGKRKAAVVGSGAEPHHREKRLFATEVEARGAAQANLEAFRRGLRSGRLEGPGNPNIYAGGFASLSGFDADVDNRYLVRSVTHRLDGGGYTMSVELEGDGVV